MCLIAFDWQPAAPERLLLAANRDEFYARPTLPLHWWAGDEVLAGRDLQANGTWMGFGRHGKFAALTNVRSTAENRTHLPSRGSLPCHFLQSELNPRQFIAYLKTMGDSYAGFNLLVGDVPRGELWWWSNAAPFDERSRAPLPPGVYGLSNALLDTPWPKVQALKHVLGAPNIQDDALLQALQNPRAAPADALPATGVPPEQEALLSAAFIASPSYGTRCSTLVRASAAGAAVRELTYPKGDVTNASSALHEIPYF
jgi:uncharacterized protein with NRDE domain